MKWRQRDKYYLASDDGLFLINRSGGEVSPLVYMAVKLPSEIIHVERGIPKDDEAARRAAVNRCMAACEAAANE